MRSSTESKASRRVSLRCRVPASRINNLKTQARLSPHPEAAAEPPRAGQELSSCPGQGLAQLPWFGWGGQSLRTCVWGGECHVCFVSSDAITSTDSGGAARQHPIGQETLVDTRLGLGPQVEPSPYLGLSTLAVFKFRSRPRSRGVLDSQVLIPSHRCGGRDMFKVPSHGKKVLVADDSASAVLNDVQAGHPHRNSCCNQHLHLAGLDGY